MKKSILQFSLIVGVAAILTFTLGRCSSDEEVPFKDRLTAYLKKDLPVVAISSDKYSAYFDFTGAMTACDNQDTEKVFNSLCQKITGNSKDFDIYKLGNSKITPFSGDVRPAQIFAQIKSAGSKQVFYAPIEETLKKIVSEGRRTILVTDFEEYDKSGQIYKQAYATDYFKTWLASGGDITFFVTDYKEGNSDKHLYYVVFDYNEHSLLRLVLDGISNAPENYSIFTLSSNAYPISTSYLGHYKGGTYHDENEEDIVSSSVEDGSDNGFFFVDSLMAESYCFVNTWEDIVENAKQQTRSNGCEVPFTHLFRNVFVNMSLNGSYKLKSFKVIMTEIHDDFNKFWGHSVAMSNKPKIVTESGETYADFEGVEAGQPYYDEKGNILPEFDYDKAPGKIVQIHDFLEFDNDLFSESLLKDSSKAELGIYFKKGADGKFSQNGDEIYRIDIVVDDVEICNMDKIDKLFYWPGNDCLSASVKNTLDDMKPKGKPIYSYFVRIL